VCVVWLYRYI